LALQIYFMNHMNVTQKSHQSNFIDVWMLGAQLINFFLGIYI
jgi:hypothetical protein